MPAFIIADIAIHDEKTYENYKQVAPHSIAKFGGRYALRGGRVEPLEGTWAPTRLVILEFPSAERARAWWASDDYAPAKALRQTSARTHMLLLDGPSLEVAAK